MGKFVDLTGQRFGKLIVLEKIGRDKYKNIIWLCECQCEEKTLIHVTSNHLKSGHTKSCGCINKELMKELGNRNKKHGKRYSKLYNTLRAMKIRTTNPKDKYYKDYGGRGISVCEEWFNSFEAFMDWAINHDYQEGLTIERKDVNGDYCPENCCWITMKEQANNKRNSRWIEFNGKKQTLNQWAKELNINSSTLKSRIDGLGWSIEKALTTPTRKTK